MVRRSEMEVCCSEVTSKLVKDLVLYVLHDFKPVK